MITHIILDIETLALPIPDDVMRVQTKKAFEAAEARFKKPEVIEAHAKEDVEAFMDRWKFSRQGARICCIGFGAVTTDCELVVNAVDGSRINGTLNSPGFFDDVERNTLKYFSAAIDEVVEEHGVFAAPGLVTFNGNVFDLPILTAALSRHDVELTTRFMPRAHIDLAQYPLERFASRKAGLGELAEIYGVDWQELAKMYPVKDFEDREITGADVQEMFEKDLADIGKRVQNYCQRDIHATAKILEAQQRLWLL